MTNEVVVRDPAIRQLVPFPLTGYDDAVKKALVERDQQQSDGPGPNDDRGAG